MRTWVRLPPGPLLYSQQGIWKDSKRGSIKAFLILPLYCISAKQIHIKEPHSSSKPRNSEEAISTKTCFRSNLCINKYRCLLLNPKKSAVSYDHKKALSVFQLTSWLHFSRLLSHILLDKRTIYSSLIPILQVVITVSPNCLLLTADNKKKK